MSGLRCTTFLAWLVCAVAASAASIATKSPTGHAPAAESKAGLLFYLSADKGTTADYSASGQAEPTFVHEVATIRDGAIGAGLQCDDLQLLAWRAPGNIYAQRGTLALFWRSRYAVGPTEFPIFRVAYADHSSWDMVWLRIDYNGRGFDAFVTDASLARTRVSVPLHPFPGPKEWIHLALSWDEQRGMRFYINGRRVAEKETIAAYDTALDQFGLHSRVISPHNVLSESNFVRGGDIDELRIYDRMLDDRQIAALAARSATSNDIMAMPAPEHSRTTTASAESMLWNRRFGWDDTEAPPPYYAGEQINVRKVEIHDAYDLKRWWWKATDGIRETTWPGVYNRSRLPGRNDYFNLPDWDCYVESGRAVTFDLSREPWNHLEMIGAAWGRMELLPLGVVNENASESPAEKLLFERPSRGHRKSVHQVPVPISGRKIRFVNTEQEEPISELAAYHVTRGREPIGSETRAFRLAAGPSGEASVVPLTEFITGRFPSRERSMLIGTPDSRGTSANTSPASDKPAAALGDAAPLPIVHVLIPNTWDGHEGALDGIAIDLPVLHVTSTHGEYVPLNIRIKDPLWPMRDMLDFTFSVKAREPKTLWFDLRDRFLPPGKAVWLSVASASPAFSGKALTGAAVRLVFKTREKGRIEHEQDRFTQLKDSFAMLVEEWPNSPKLNLWVRFEADLKDLLRINPGHVLGRQYAAISALAAPRPALTLPQPPTGVPRWAFLQTELLARVRKFVMWQIEHRQVAYGDFGGGISDDTDMTNLWPGVALMGCEPDAIMRSLRALLEAAYKNGMFTNGLPTIQSDELHSYEEGINCLAQNLILDFGSPKQLERAMVTARAVAGLTGVNAAGHRHLRSGYFSGTRLAEEEPWGRAKPQGYLITHAAQLLVDFNGSPLPQKNLLELTDGLLAHRRVGADGSAAMPAVIRFVDDQEIPWRSARTPVPYFPWHLYWGAWKWTGERRYLEPILDRGTSGLMEVNANAMDILQLREAWKPKLGPATPAPYRWTAGGRAVIPREEIPAWQIDRDKTRLEKIFGTLLESCQLIEYINTEGSLWTDRISVPTVELQRTRLGGVALVRNALYPGHTVGWEFASPAKAESVAILIPDATPKAFTVVAFNLETKPVHTTMTGWNVDPGEWEIRQGIDTDDDDVADRDVASRSQVFERSRAVHVTLPPRVTTVLTFKLKKPTMPYWSRCDLGIDPQDVVVHGSGLKVRVHSVGAVNSGPATVVFRDRGGSVRATAQVPALAAPHDLSPQVVEVDLTVSTLDAREGGAVEIDPHGALEEITRINNVVHLDAR